MSHFAPTKAKAGVSPLQGKRGGGGAPFHLCCSVFIFARGRTKYGKARGVCKGQISLAVSFFRPQGYHGRRPTQKETAPTHTTVENAAGKSLMHSPERQSGLLAASRKLETAGLYFYSSLEKNSGRSVPCSGAVARKEQFE